jgi:DNA-binding transcriptional LysR family regulator
MNSVRGPQLLAGLRDFEVAARCGSFAAAGNELGVSASAVSQQVKSLELRLGIALFNRKPQSLTLTRPGEKLLLALTSAFELIDSSLSALRPPQETITLSMPAIFAANWFLPRMKRFRANYPRFDVLPRSSGTLLEPSVDGVSAAVRFGKAGWGTLDCRFLFSEVLAPMCGPAHLNEIVQSQATLEVHQQNLLVSEQRPDLWLEWAAATRCIGDFAKFTAFGDDLLVTQAAMNDHGVALLDANLVSHQLKINTLAVFKEMSRWETGQGWYLVFEESRSTEESLTALFDWILLELKETHT